MKRKQLPGQSWPLATVSVFFLFIFVWFPGGKVSPPDLFPPIEPPSSPTFRIPGNTYQAAGCTNDHCLFLGRLNRDWYDSPWFQWDIDSARLLYQNLFLPGENTTIEWTGSVSGCIAGTTGISFRTAVLQRINYFRQAAGVPPLTGLNDTYNRKAQAAALMMSRNNDLDHTPPSSWLCYSPEGYEGAGNSNLFLGVHGPEAITGYIRDPGSSNYPVGHRRWILYPQTQAMGSGDIPPNGNYRPANALWVFDSHFGDLRPATRNPFVAWPPPGHVPYQVVFPRWSFSYPGANFSNASIHLTKDGSTVAVTKQPVIDGFGENTLVWQINGMGDFDAWPKPDGISNYTVSIRGVRVNGEVIDFVYPVSVFRP